MKNGPLNPSELERLVKEAMRLTQSRADLLKRNDELLKQLIRYPSRFSKRKARKGKPLTADSRSEQP